MPEIQILGKCADNLVLSVRVTDQKLSNSTKRDKFPCSSDYHTWKWKSNLCVSKIYWENKLMTFFWLTLYPRFNHFFDGDIPHNTHYFNGTALLPYRPPSQCLNWNSPLPYRASLWICLSCLYCGWGLTQCWSGSYSTTENIEKIWLQ